MVEDRASIRGGVLARAQVLAGIRTPPATRSLYRKAAEAARTPDMKYSATASLTNWYLAQKPPRYDVAEQQCRALVQLDPQRIGGYRGLVLIYVITGRVPELDAALAEAEKAIPDNLITYYRAGAYIVTEGKDYARAERYLRKYLTQEPEAGGPSPAVARWRLGQALEKQGKRAEAIAEMEQAVKLKPDFEEAKKDLRRLKAT
jgi:tetratricopeptide (TPR) repeat protein